MQSAWEEFYKAHGYFHLEPHEALPGLVAKAEQLNFYKLLDLGCGAGHDLLYLAERGFEVTGVDFSPAAVANAEDLLQSKGFSGKVYVDNLFDKITTYTPGEFQVIIAINALEYTDRSTFESALEQIVDALAAQGLFLLVVSSKDSPIIQEVPEQLFFNQEELTSLAGQHFNILDVAKDKNQCLVLLLQRKQHEES